ILFVKSRKFKRLLVESSGLRSRCRRRRKSWVRMKRGWAEDCRGSIRHTAGSGGRAEKNSSSRAVSNSRPEPSVSTNSGYYAGEHHERRAQEEITKRWISLVPSYISVMRASR